MEKKHGGKRSGAGRPSGSGRYGEKTLPIRVPASLIDEVQELVNSKGLGIPFYSNLVAAGFPTDNEAHTDTRMDLQVHLVKDLSTTYCIRATGDSMIKAGIFEGDILVVDASIEPRHGKVVIAALNGQMTVKRLHKEKGVTMLLPENEKYAPIRIDENTDLVIKGVVTYVIHGL